MKLDPKVAWEPYRPTATDPWDARKVGHLYRRAAFGATRMELKAGLADGCDETLDRVLNGRPESDDFVRTSEYMVTERSLPAGTPGVRLAGWWLDRMLKTAHPLREKMALFWHNHFATSIVKVQNARYMLGQYRLLSRHALGRFGDLLREISLDPATAVWLDTVGSTKGKPNENYARELMELFSLGIGHYSEADVREAARAFTGYAIERGKMTLAAKAHDDGTKTVLGQTGKWGVEDAVRICLEQPPCARFLVRKVYRYLVSESDAPADELIEPLAERYRSSGYDTAGLVSTVLRSRLFFSPAAYRQKIKSPVSFALGIVRGMEGRVGTLNLAEALESLGQVPFSPPSVKGWDGGPAWLNGQTLLFRQNLALALTSTEDNRFGRRCDPVALLARHEKPTVETALDFMLDLFLQGDVPAESRARLKEYVDRSRTAKVPAYWTAEDAANHRLRAVTHLVLTLPEFQLD